MKIETREELWEVIKKAYEIDGLLPIEKPSNYGCLLGKMVVIPDDERSPQDVLEDINNLKSSIMQADYDLWFSMMSKMVRLLTPTQRKVLELRAKNYGWKRIGKLLKDKGYTDRLLHRATLWRIYERSLDKLMGKKHNKNNVKTIFV